MPKEYKFTKRTVTTVVVGDGCECEDLKDYNPCKKCDDAAWDAFHDEDGTVKELPIEWEVA